jgi:hypothetical protein
MNNLPNATDKANQVLHKAVSSILVPFGKTYCIRTNLANKISKLRIALYCKDGHAIHVETPSELDIVPIIVDYDYAFGYTLCVKEEREKIMEEELAKCKERHEKASITK